ncbi:hypothetical protein OTB20_27875 [Streptomyces sp. H27-H1]|uniref:hypothetical protein n=1 Tax=Streptomyces sp. H27-H1 TaxID=2996461 RepID=UPI00226D6B03|nr:hypothetical protein [Streptomyces sp. H27-H1]MCY0929943.1 hypothetical protein [Streptomyces sp. H27-H1]
MTAAQYEPAAGTVDVKAADVTLVTRSLRTGKVTPSKPAVEIVLPPGRQRARTPDLANPGLGTAFTVAEDAAWLKVSPASGDLPTGGKAPLTLSVDTAGLTRAPSSRPT